MQFRRRSLLLTAALGAGSTLLAACGNVDDDDHEDRNIVQVAQSLPDFSILVEAVVAADLATTLSGPGPFTVFAPTNAAFAALLSELGVTKAALLADKPLLTAVLTYNVVSGRVLARRCRWARPSPRCRAAASPWAATW
nr:fasciclin domain-containing protein [Aquincola sp. J276]